MNAFSQSLIKKVTSDARTLVERLDANQGFAIDEGGKIKHEWLQVCDKVFFGTWFVDGVKSGKIRAVVAKLDGKHSKHLRIKCGMPFDGYDIAYIAVANSVSAPKYIPVRSFHRSLHRSCEARDGAGPITLAKQHLVWVIVDVILWKCFEELDGFSFVVMSASGRFGLARPVHRHIFDMPFVERMPILIVPGVIQCLH